MTLVEKIGRERTAKKIRKRKDYQKQQRQFAAVVAVAAAVAVNICQRAGYVSFLFLAQTH